SSSGTCLTTRSRIKPRRAATSVPSGADLVTMDDLVPQPALPMRAVIMAGGYGARLQPLTDELPKPMLPVGGRPLLELIVESLRQAGIRRVNVTTHYRPETIRDHFGNGDGFGVELNYVT